MTKEPKTIEEHELAGAALSRMEVLKITSLVVIDSKRIVTGVVHLHDLWRTELF
jgi:arabinose-5-phosphate isomerase